MALIVNEETFIRGGGHSPADCVLIGNFTGNAGETSIVIAPGLSTNTTIATGSAAMRALRFITFYLRVSANPTESYPKAIKSYDQTNQSDIYTVTFPANTTWEYKLDGVDNGLAPVV